MSNHKWVSNAWQLLGKCTNYLCTRVHMFRHLYISKCMHIVPVHFPVKHKWLTLCTHLHMPNKWDTIVVLVNCNIVHSRSLYCQQLSNTQHVLCNCVTFFVTRTVVYIDSVHCKLWYKEKVLQQTRDPRIPFAYRNIDWYPLGNRPWNRVLFGSGVFIRFFSVRVSWNRYQCALALAYPYAYTLASCG